MGDIDHRYLEEAPLPALFALLADARAPMRADAACAIGDRLRGREGTTLSLEQRDLLAVLLDDQDFAPRFEAAIALALAKDSRGTRLLVLALAKRALRLDAIYALGQSGDQNAVAPLLLLLSRWLMPWADKLQAAAALCALGDSEGARYLVEALSSRRFAERAAAAHFLGDAGHPEARVRLEAILAQAGHELADVAARALGLLGDLAARPALQRALEVASGELREDITAALAALDRARARS